jgi:2-keto-3-deoxy-L-rhamnonate aldolase RhmA
MSTPSPDIPLLCTICSSRVPEPNVTPPARGRPGERVAGILREGGIALGSYVGPFGGPAMIEIIGLAGFDAAFIDLEHNAFDLGEVRSMILAAEVVGITAMIRTPGLDTGLILRLLDYGAGGIYVPHVTSAADARAVVDAARYPPIGDRGLLPTSRAARYGSLGLTEHLRRAREEVVLGVMIEDAAGVDRIEEIASVEGLDLIAIGPTDLSRSLGVLGQPNDPKLEAAISRVLAAIRSAGIARPAMPVAHASYPRSVAELVALGVGYANCGPGPEARLLAALAAQVKDLRSQALSAGAPR